MRLAKRLEDMASWLSGLCCAGGFLWLQSTSLIHTQTLLIGHFHSTLSDTSADLTRLTRARQWYIRYRATDSTDATDLLFYLLLVSVVLLCDSDV